jgi:predicted permease
MVLAYAVLVAVVTALFCGFTPALQMWRPDLVLAMRPEGGSAKHPRLRLRNLMVAGQAAVSVVLLLISALVVRSIGYVTRVDPGFDRDRVLSARIDLGRDTLPAQRIAFARAMVEHAQRLPRVESASVTSLVPLGGNAASTSVWIEERGPLGGIGTLWMNVGPDYFKTMGTAVRRGREFAASDRQGSAPVAVVNEAFVKAYFPGGDALGKRVSISRTDAYREIVGVVRNSDYQFYGESPQPQLFRPFYQTNGEVFLEIRTAGTVNDYREALTRAASELNPRAVVDLKTLREATDLEFQIRRLGSGLLAGTGAMGLLLAMVGLYGVVSYAVSRSTPEIGIRMALGASRGVVLQAVMRQGLVLVGAGVVAGSAIALGAARLIAFALSGISPADPVAYLATAALMLAAGLAACWIPARRAARIEPMTALRYE